MPSLNLPARVIRQIIAKIIKPELMIGAVNNVALIGPLPRTRP